MERDERDKAGLAPGLGRRARRTSSAGSSMALPRSPGVYLFRDARDELLYVGKAKVLRSRVRSYFTLGHDTRPGIHQLVERIERIELIVTQSEAEALHLEQNLIKRHRPPFNVRLRDDKSFPYIAVTVADDYPRVMFTRERHRRGTVYFGPYANAKKVRETLDVLNRVFQFRPCEGPTPGRHSGTPCLDFHIERCAAPCIGAITREAYGEVIDAVIAFLGGDTRTITRDAHSRHEGRGRRGALRGRGALPQPAPGDRLARRATGGRQAGGGNGGRDRARAGRRAGGGAGVPTARRQAGRPPRLPSRERRRAGSAHRARVVLPRVLQRRAGGAVAGDRPARSHRHGRARGVPLRPSRGCRSRCVLRLAARSSALPSSQAKTPSLRSSTTPARRRNAAADGSRRSSSSARRSTSRACRCGSSASTSPTSRGERSSRRCRCSSTASRGRRSTAASQSAASTGQDDFASMAQVVGRRFARLRDGDGDPSFGAVPNLVVIDGGKGQLSAALDAITRTGDLPRLAVVALAKRDEEIFVPGRAPADPPRSPRSRASSCCSRSATRRTGSRCATTGVVVTPRASPRSSTACRASALFGGGRSCSTSARPSASSRRAVRSSRAFPGSRRRQREPSTRSSIAQEAPRRARSADSSVISSRGPRGAAKAQGSQGEEDRARSRSRTLTAVIVSRMPTLSASNVERAMSAPRKT